MIESNQNPNQQQNMQPSYAGTAYPMAFPQDDEIDLVELFKTLLKYWKFIAGTVIVITFLTAVYSLFIPPVFTSSTRFFIPEAEKSGGGYMSAISNLGLGSIIGGGNTSIEIVVNILNSRRMAKDVIKKFDLINYYYEPSEKKPEETDPHKLTKAAIITVQGNLSVNKDKTNFITLSFSDKDPEVAAKIANFFVKNLDQINEELAITSQKPLVKVLDVAEVPIARSRPNRRMIVIIGFLTSGIFSVFLAFAFEYIKNILDKK